MALEFNTINGVATIWDFKLIPSSDGKREIGVIRIKEDNSFLKTDGTRDHSKSMFIDLKFFQDTDKRRFDKTMNYLVKGERINYSGILKDNNWTGTDGVKHSVKFIEVQKLIPFSMLPRLTGAATGASTDTVPAETADIPAAVGYDEDVWGEN